MGKRQSPHERRDPNGQQTHQGTSGSAGGPVVRGPVVRGRPSTQHHHTASIEQRQSRGQRPTDCSHPDGGGTNGHHCRFGQCLLRPTPCAPCHAAHPKEPYATCTKDKHATRAKIPGRRLQNPGTTQTPPAAEKELRHVRSHCVTHRAGRTSFTQRGPRSHDAARENPETQCTCRCTSLNEVESCHSHRWRRPGLAQLWGMKPGSGHSGSWDAQ